MSSTEVASTPSRPNNSSAAATSAARVRSPRARRVMGMCCNRRLSLVPLSSLPPAGGGHRCLHHRKATRMVDVEALVPAGPLGEFLDTAGADGRGETPAVVKIGEGRSNLTFRVERGGRAWVLRRPPMGDLPETAHDMMREHRVLAALADTPVRAPRPFAACPDTAVIGVPFYLMEVVDGIVIRGAPPEQFAEEERAGLGHEMIDALAELHLVDPAAVG